MSPAATHLPRTGFRFMLVIQNGPDRGNSFQLLPPRVTIGRGEDNHVILSDPRASRQSAVIEFSLEKIIITDVSKRNTLTLNGENIQSASIKDGDMIGIGTSVLAFVVEALPLAPSISPSAPIKSGTRSNIVPFNPGFDAPPASSVGSSAGSSSSEGKRIRFYVIIALVGGAFIWLMTSGHALAPKEKPLRTTEDIKKDADSTDERIEQMIKKRTFKTEEERTRYEEAQKHYLEGFRDYAKGQWGRSMRSFETARAIDPDHELAKRYFKLAEKNRDEMIAVMILEGRQYKEKHMYARCSSSLEKALVEIPNRDEKYRETEAMKKECDLLQLEKFN